MLCLHAVSTSTCFVYMQAHARMQHHALLTVQTGCSPLPVIALACALHVFATNMSWQHGQELVCFA